MTNLAQAMCEQGLVCGFGEVRRLVHSRAVTINGVPAESWDMPVKPGDVITCGKRKRMVVGDDCAEFWA